MYNSNENHNLSSYFISNKKDGRCRENRSVKSLFIYFKNCESNSFIKKIIYTRCGTRGEIVS